MDRGHGTGESATFWATVAGVVLVLGGALVSVGVAMKSSKQSVWAEPWFDVGVAALVVGVLILGWSVRLYFVRNQPSSLTSPNDLSISKPSAPSVLPPDVSSASGTESNLADSPAARHVVDVTPEDLAGFFDAHTSIQADKLVAPYLGKWMRVSGPMGNVSGFTTFSQVTFAFGTFGSMSVYMYFHDRDVVENRLAVLGREDQITVLGQIDRVDATRVQLESCELVDVSRLESPEPAASELVFDQAPPGLADMTEAGLREHFASPRTKAQADELLRQHRGEPVSVSGEVEDVDLSGIPSVRLRSAGVSLILFFDAADDDARRSLLSLHHGDKIVVSGQIHSFTTSTIAGHIGISIGVDKCKLLNTRGGRS